MYYQIVLFKRGHPSNKAIPTKGHPSYKVIPTKGHPSYKAIPTKGHPSSFFFLLLLINSFIFYPLIMN